MSTKAVQLQYRFVTKLEGSPYNWVGLYKLEGL